MNGYLVTMLVCLAATVFASEKEALDSEEHKRNVSELVGKLGSEDFAAREQAEMELRGMGESVLPLLKAALIKATDAEIKSRLGQIIEGAEAYWTSVRTTEGNGQLSMTLKPVVVSLGSGKRTLKVVITLNMESASVLKELKVNSPMKSITEELVGIQIEDVDSEKMKALKQKLLNKINRSLKSGQLLRIYFTEFVIQ